MQLRKHEISIKDYSQNEDRNYEPGLWSLLRIFKAGALVKCYDVEGLESVDIFWNSIQLQCFEVFSGRGPSQINHL
jgi:hypothetical protein